MFIHGCGGIGQHYPGTCGDAPGNTYFNPAILHNGVFEKTEGFCTDVFFDRGIQWIDRKRRAGAPFFAYIATNAPHAPLSCPPEYKRRYQDAGLDDATATYFGMVTNIDDNVGRLMARLPALGSKGLWEPRTRQAKGGSALVARAPYRAVPCDNCFSLRLCPDTQLPSPPG